VEVFARWAAEGRFDVRGIREAERRLIELQGRIEAAADELCAAVAETDDLCLRYGLRVDSPMWRDPLCEVLAEASSRFVRWGQEPEVAALVAFETRSFYSPRPGVLDLVKIAGNVGVLHSDVESPIRNHWTGEWLRTAAPEVRAADALSEQAIRLRSGSGPESEAAQLRQLFAALRRIALRNGWEGAGPLEWLTEFDISELCRIAAGDAEGFVAAEGFDLDTVRKARAAFTRMEG
jgi:hypothetical protein